MTSLSLSNLKAGNTLPALLFPRPRGEPCTNWNLNNIFQMNKKQLVSFVFLSRRFFSFYFHSSTLVFLIGAFISHQHWCGQSDYFILLFPPFSGRVYWEFVGEIIVNTLDLHICQGQTSGGWAMNCFQRDLQLNSSSTVFQLDDDRQVG